LCYGMPLRSKIEFTHLQAFDLIADLFDSRSIIIFCMVPASELIFKPDESQDVIKKMQEIYSNYVRWMACCRTLSREPGRILRYQWSADGAFQALCNRLKRII